MANMIEDETSDDFELVDAKEASLEADVLAKVQAWLRPTDYEAASSEFHRHLSSRAPDTGLWICNTARYRDWHNSSDHGSLWIKGVPGAGKSVTVASIATHLRSTEEAPVLTFFFRHIILANSTPRGLVRDWLSQLVPWSTNLQASLEPLLGRDLDDYADEHLWQYLLIGLSGVSNAYCVVDALDEMDLRADNGFLARLNALASFRPGSVKVLMTSRPKQYLQSALRENAIVHISLEQDLVGKDIAAFISHRLAGSMPGPDHEALRNEVRAAMLGRCGGLFLYARLLLDQVIPKLNERPQVDVGDLLSSLPVGLEDMYNTMLFRQMQALGIEPTVQTFLLEAVTHSARPLRLNELAQALDCVFPHSCTASKAKDLARSACSPLLEVLEDETVQVIHHSFTEFLLDTGRSQRPRNDEQNQFPALDPAMVHKRLALTCLEYLQSRLSMVVSPKHTSRPEENCYDDDESNDEDAGKNDLDEVLAFDYREARLQFPFLEYATQNWAHHASNYDVEDKGFFRAIGKFLQFDNIAYRRWLAVEWNLRKSKRELPSIMHVAAFAGLTHLARTLDQSNMMNALDGNDRTPLHWASKRGHSEIVIFLLEHDANPHAQDCDGLQPIHEAAKRGHAKIVEMLLQAGVDPMTPKSHEDYGWRSRGGGKLSRGQTALQYVCRNGYTETIVKMAPFLKTESLEEGLCSGCLYGRGDIVRSLLRHTNVSPDAQYCGATALYLAVQSLDVVCVEALLSRKANVHIMSDFIPPRRIVGGMGPRKGTAKVPLHKLFEVWKNDKLSTCQNIFQMLLRAGAKLDAEDGDGYAPLKVVFHGDERRQSTTMPLTAVRALLDAGALLTDTDGDSLLYRCIRITRDLSYLGLLLEHGPSITHRGSHGSTLLHAAFLGSHGHHATGNLEALVKYLLHKGARADVKNDLGQTALEAAAASRECSLQVFKLLLETCSDLETRQSCIWHLDRWNNKDDIEMFLGTLLESGVSLEPCNKFGKTPLLAFLGTYEPAFTALVQAGAQINVLDYKGRGVLHHFVALSKTYRNPLPRFCDLVKLGLNPLAVDNDQNGLLHEIGRAWSGVPGQLQLVRQLFSYGAFADTRNTHGQTPLHVYFKSKQSAPSVFVPGDLRSLLEALQHDGNGPDLNARDDDGWTPLHSAAVCSEVDLFHLLQAGAEAMALTKDHRSVLHLAARARQGNVLEYATQNLGERLLNKTDKLGRTALHDACTSGLSESVYCLIMHGADVSCKDSNGRTALHACAESVTEQHIWSGLQQGSIAAGHLRDERDRPSGHLQLRRPWYKGEYISELSIREDDYINVPDMIDMLIRAGADVRAKDNNEHTPLDLALSLGCFDMVQYLATLYPRIEDLISYVTEEQRIRATTDLALARRQPSSIAQISDESLKEIFEHPNLYINRLSGPDLEYAISMGADLTGEKRGFPGRSLLHELAEHGLTKKMKHLSSLVRVYDDDDLVLSTLQRFQPRIVNPESFEPVLRSACIRQRPNMSMLKLLVEKYQVDVNKHALALPHHHASFETLVPGPTALHALAEANAPWQLHAIRYLVEQGADPNARNEQGETPLHIASAQPNRYGWNSSKKGSIWRPSFVKILLDLGADPDALDSDGKTALHNACSTTEIIRLLLEHGVSLTAGSSSPLFSVIQQQNLNGLGVLLDAGVDLNCVDPNKTCNLHHTIESQKRYAMFCACFIGGTDSSASDPGSLVKLLIESGANLYAPLDDMATLIHYVLEHAQYPVIQSVLDCAGRIDFNARDQQGRTVFHAACNWVECLPGYRHQHWVPKVQGPIMMILNTGMGVDLYAIDNESKTVLHHLLDNPDMEEDVILEFLKHPVCQALIHSKDTHGYTPMHYALRTLRPVLCEALLTLGADLLASDPAGATALHHIARQCLRGQKPQRVSRLNEDEELDYQETCLALWNKFLAQGGNVDARDEEGRSPLLVYLASRPIYSGRRIVNAENCHVEHYGKFLADADVHVRDNGGGGALHVVARRDVTWRTKDGHDAKLFDFMVKRGLDPLAEDDLGRTALDVAAGCERKDILELYQYRS